MQGGASGPEPHFHRSIIESFDVLEGTIALFDGRTWIDTEPGEALAPDGADHALAEGVRPRGPDRTSDDLDA
jgi:hypothetical protein